jgi:hypothetical protein
LILSEGTGDIDMALRKEDWVNDVAWPWARNFLGGYSSGVCLVLVGHPFDTIKVRMQTEKSGGVCKRC